MKKLKIAFIDVLGLTYDPTTLEKFGLGGSESAIIYMAKELQSLGFEVTVFNNCIDSRAKEGVYSGVKYIDISRLSVPNSHTCDIMVASRSVKPFLSDQIQFEQLRASATHKVIWLHDTFCDGDHLVEDLVNSGQVDELFTLSDFHTSYIANCDHGKRRNFEVLKNKIFMTRNGARKYIDEVDVTQKDKNLFIYNASLTKGMMPLVERIWPKIKQQIPTAKLKVIGGYYRFRDGAAPDAQEQKWRELVDKSELKALDIEFTGVIPQREIATYLANASFMIFPGAFPETFGISSLESLLYNTPLITTRFGALEETAIDLACYKIDYAIEPNSLFPNINIEQQVDKFVDIAVQAYHNTYLHSQKMQYCNIVHDIADWSGVALQWKQHFFKKLGHYLPVDEYRTVMKLNSRLHEVYGRRYSNHEEWAAASSYPQQKISVISPFYNSANYIEDCINSVVTQDYDNYTFHLIDDYSTDNGFEIAKAVVARLPQTLQNKIFLYRNNINKGSVYNYVTHIQGIISNDIIMMLDGDDSLMPNNSIFQKYNTLYDGSVEFTYGSMWSMIDNIPLVAQPYPKHIRESKTYRNYKFAWNMPYTHLRTFRKNLLEGVEQKAFKDADGNWLKAGGDTSIFYTAIENAHPDKIRAISDIVYRYNDKNPLNDYKVNGEEQTRNANFVLNNNKPNWVYIEEAALIPNNDVEQIFASVCQTSIIPKATIQASFMTPKPEPVQKKRILLGIPTAKYIETETFKSIYDLDVPDGYEITFQCFYGYTIDQVRNLIGKWAEGFDYLFSVDSDIVLPQDTLVKMLNHNVDMVSGVYIQRKPDQEILEIHRKNNQGGVSSVSFKDIQPAGLHEIDSCGFGCVLVKSDVIRKIGYPYFQYKSALDHAFTISEDIFFCKRAQEVGAKIYVDSSIVCKHIGNTIFLPTPI